MLVRGSLRPDLSRLRRRVLGTLALAGAVLAAAPAAAQALEDDPSYAWGPLTPFIFYAGVDERTATVPGLPPTAPAHGIDVLGDSISTGVPYVVRGAQDGVRVDVRSWGGWNIRLHRSVTGWPSTDRTSVEKAMTDDERAVIVELGTNDLYCLRADEACPETPADDDPSAADWVAAGRAAIRAQVRALATQLLGAGKCVVWAGPRPARTLRPEDVAFFDGLLAELVAAHPGRVHTVRWATLPAVVADFAEPESDGLHPHTRAGRAAIADALIGAAEDGCHLGAAPPVARIDAGPRRTTHLRAPAFSFSARQQRATFRCRLDRQPSVPCRSPVTVGPLADGRHTFAVSATNRAGVGDRAPVVRAFSVDAWHNTRVTSDR